MSFLSRSLTRKHNVQGERTKTLEINHRIHKLVFRDWLSAGLINDSDMVVQLNIWLFKTAQTNLSVGDCSPLSSILQGEVLEQGRHEIFSLQVTRVCCVMCQDVSHMILSTLHC